MVNRRGRPAGALLLEVEPGHIPVTVQGLTIERRNIEGERDFYYDFAKIDLPDEFLYLFLAKFAQEASPRGSWRAPITIRGAINTIRSFAKFCRQCEIPVLQVQDLSLAVLNEFRLYVSEPAWQSFTRLIRDAPGLMPTARAYVSKRTPKLVGRVTAYSSSDFAAAQKSVGELVSALEKRVKQTMDSADQCQSRGGLGAVIRALLDGDEAAVGLAFGHYLEESADRSVCKTLTQIRASLFISQIECTLLVVALAMDTGWNLTSIIELLAPSPSASPDNARRGEYNLILEKRRRGEKYQFEKRAYPFHESGSRSDLMTRIIAITAPIRSATQNPIVAKSLFVFRSRSTRIADEEFARITNFSTVRLEANYKELRGRINPRRIRRTVNVVVRRKPNQNSDRTHNSVYVIPEEIARDAAVPSIVAGQNEALSVLKSRFQGQIAMGEKLDADGKEEVGALAGCKDPSSSPIQGGGPCRQSFLLCFSCPNAVVRVDYLPRNAALWRCLVELRSASEHSNWEQSWQPVLDRIEDLAFGHLSAEQWQGALDSITDDDLKFVRMLLIGDLDV